MLGLESKGARQILGYFMLNPGREHHLRELATVLEMDPGNLSREMKRLVSAGLFQVREKGRLKLFSLNKEHPLFKELRAIILKTQGAVPLLRNALTQVVGIEEAILYGSFATGEVDASSDIDVLIVGTPDILELTAPLRALERRLGREIHFRILARDEWQRRLKKKDPFLTSALGGKTVKLIERNDR